MVGDVDLEKLGISQEEWDALSEEEQAELLAQQGASQQQPGGQEQDDERIKGILRDLQEERRKRQEAEAEISSFQNRLQGMEEKYQELLKKMEGNSREEEQLNDDDYLTVKSARNLLEKRLEEQRERIHRLEGEILASKMQASEEATRAKYSEKQVGKELAYEKVLDEGTKALIKENPAYRDVILRSPNPAEEAYRIGLTHPKFQEILKKNAGGEIIDKLAKPRPKIGMDRGGKGSGFDAASASVEDLMKLSDEELDKLAGKT